MRVCLETTALRSKLAGVGTYTLGLANALIEFHDELELTAFDGLRFLPLRGAVERGFDVTDTNADTVGSRLMQLARGFGPLRSVARKAKAARFRRVIPRLDVFHALNFMPPGKTLIPSIPLIYDLSHVRHPETHPQERVDWLNENLSTLHHYPLINTVSHFTANEISSVYGYPLEQIHITAPGIKPAYLKPYNLKAPPRIAGHELLANQYLLSVGTFEPRKNLGTVLKAYAMLNKEQRLALPLVIVGQYGWGKNDLDQAAALRNEGSLIVAGYVPENVLHGLYAHAAAFLFPSHYEGFGMPVAEAMACGTPVIASDIAVLREVGGETIKYAETLNAEAWCDAIQKTVALSNEERLEATTAARSQIAHLTWQNNAALTCAMYQKRATMAV